MMDDTRFEELRAALDAVGEVIGRADTEDLLDLVLRIPLGDVDGLAAETLGLGEALRDHVADDHHRGAEQLR